MQWLVETKIYNKSRYFFCFESQLKDHLNCLNLNTILFLKGVLHLLPQKAPKLACFVRYLKIINIFLKNNIYIL